MKNYEELLKEIGIDIPDDKKEEFEKSFHENYKTIAEVEKLKGKLETSQGDNTNLNERLEQSQKDLEELRVKLEESGEDATKIKELQSQITDLQEKNTQQSQEFEAEIKKRDYMAHIEDASKDLKFTSNSAKKTFIDECVRKDFTIDNGKVLGFDEFVEDYKKNDSGAFVQKTDINLGGHSDKLDNDTPKADSKKHAF